MWTPLLNASAVELRGLGVPPPYGLVFSLLMAALMLGSHAFQLASPLAGTLLPFLKPEPLAAGLCATAAAACLVLALFGASDHWTGLAALLVFEFCVGAYYPSIGHLRGKHVPFESRGAAAHLAKTILAVLVRDPPSRRTQARARARSRSCTSPLLSRPTQSCPCGRCAVQVRCLTEPHPFHFPRCAPVTCVAQVLGLLLNLASSSPLIFMACAVLLGGAFAALKHADPYFAANNARLAEMSSDSDDSDGSA